MALVQLGPIISSLKGSIGGTTFSAVRNGTVAKNRVTGKRINTQKQLGALSVSKSVAYLWSSLTPIQKDLWNDYALANTFTDRYGVTSSLTGYNWCRALNQNSLLKDSLLIDEPPVYASSPALPSIGVTAYPSDLLFQFSTPINPLTTFVVVFVTPPTRRRAKYNRGAMLLLDLSGVDTTESFSIKEAWELATGLDYSTIYDETSFLINVLAYPFNTISYVPGIGQTCNSVVNPIDPVGIGTMIIGSTNIVG